MSKLGLCRRCGASALLGERWQGRSSLDGPDLYCTPCSRSYPVAWTAEQIEDAREQLLDYVYAKAEAMMERERSRPRKSKSDVSGAVAS